MKAKPTPHDLRASLFDMLENARKIREYLDGLSFEDFWNSSSIRDAVALRLAMIGEAAKGVDSATAARLKNIPFASIRGLRNHIVHDYGAIDFRNVWQIAQEDILPLIATIEEYLKKSE